MPTLKLNNSKCLTNYLWGDWDLIKNENKYDIILGS